MEPLGMAIVGGLVCGILGFRFWYGMQSHHRIWLAVIDGQLLRLEVSKDQCTITLDDKELLHTTIESKFKAVATPTGLRMRRCFRFDINEQFDALDKENFHFFSDWQHSNKGEVSLIVAGEKIPLMEASENPEAFIAQLKGSLRGKIHHDIQDERWNNILNLLTIVRTVVEEEDVATIDRLQKQLATRFQMLAELTGKDAAAVWSDAEERAQCIASIEEEIEMGCSIVQQLHERSIQKRQSMLAAEDLQDVFALLVKMDAEQEVEEPETSHKRKILRKIAQKRQL